jgi:hypothetical protein
MSVSEYFDYTPIKDGKGLRQIVVVRDVGGDGEYAPQWLRDAVWAAHEAAGVTVPNDWVYDKCRSIFMAFDDGGYGLSEDQQDELAEMLVDIYYRDLTDWLASDYAFASWVDDALAHQNQIWDALGMAQFYCLSAMVSVLAEAYVANDFVS